MNVKSQTSVVAFFAVTCLVTNLSFGQQVIAEIDFDNGKPPELFGYAFGGYGPSGGSDAVQFGDQFVLKQNIADRGGLSGDMQPLKLKLTKLSAEFGANHPQVAATQKQIDALAATPNKCAQAVLDATKVDVPVGANYDYAGFATGGNFDLSGKTLPEIVPENVVVSFDAKVTGTDALDQSKLIVRFLAEDGDDEGEDDDIVLQFARGQAEGTFTFEINSDYKHFEFALSSMDIEKGALKDLKTARLKAIGFTVQAQGVASNFGQDNDNILFVDNIKMISK